MGSNVMGTSVVCQVGVIVRDVEKTAQAWANVLGVEAPSWSLTDPKEESHINLLGKSTDARAKLAFLSLGDQVQLELIEPVGEPSTWAEFLKEHGQGIHHIAFHLKGMDEVIARLEAHNITTIQRGDYTGGRYGYMDGVEELGVILELLENFD